MEAITWLEGAVSFELSPKENLSNGDEVTVTAVVDNDTAKPGIDVENKNIYYGIYKLSISSGENEFSYYMYCTFQNLMLLPDGTCSVDLTDYSIPEVSVDFWGEIQGEGFKSGDYYYAGYEDLDSLFNHCVTKNIEWYEYESGEAAN